MFRCYMCGRRIKGAYWAYHSVDKVFVPLCRECSEELLKEERRGESERV